MRIQRAIGFVRVLGACGAVLVPLPADAFELSGGVSFGGLQIGADPMLAVSPFVGLLWRTEAGFLLEAQNELADAQLDTTEDRKQRLDFIQAAFNNALMTWQRIKELQSVGMRGGDAASETQAKAAAFRLRVLWLKEKANTEPNPSGSLAQDGLDTTIGTGVFPDGIAGVTDLKKAQLARVEALQSSAQEWQAMYVSGLVTLEVSLVSQMELALAQLDTTDDNQKRLDYLQAGFNSALLVWQRVKELQSAGVRGGDAASLAQATALVFKLRVMWLKEKAKAESKPILHSLGAMTSGVASENVYPCYVLNTCKETHGRAQPIIIYMERRRLAARRLQTVGIWQSNLAIHRAAPARLRTRTQQGRCAQGAGYP